MVSKGGCGPVNSISTFLSERIAAGDFPSAVYLLAEGGRMVFAEALGNSVVEPQRLPRRSIPFTTSLRSRSHCLPDCCVLAGLRMETSR